MLLEKFEINKIKLFFFVSLSVILGSFCNNTLGIDVFCKKLFFNK